MNNAGITAGTAPSAVVGVNSPSVCEIATFPCVPFPNLGLGVRENRGFRELLVGACSIVKKKNRKSKVVKGNSASLITQDLINQSLILQELETPPGWDYHSGSACTMKSIKHIKMYKCWLWPQASVLSCPLTAVPSVPLPAGKSGNQRTSIRLLQNTSKSFVFIKSLSIGFFCSERGHFLRSNQQK